MSARKLGRLGRTAWVAACGLSLLLAACGGDGGRAAPPAPTAPDAPLVPSVAYSVRAFEFSWPAMSGATFYRLGEDPTNSGTFSVLADNLVATSHAVRDLPLLQPPTAWRYALQACNAQGCGPWSGVATPEATNATGYFKSPDPAALEAGVRLALAPDGNTLAMGSRSALDLFVRDGGRWRWAQTLGFGPSRPTPAFSNEGSLLVGLPTLDLAFSDQGQVQVFSRTPTGWVWQETWDSPVPRVGGTFGADVGLSSDGSVAVVSETGGAAGRFHVFRRQGGVWSLEQTVEPDHPHAGSLFGVNAKLSADGQTIVVGAQREDSGSTVDETDSSAVNAGAAFVYRYDSGLSQWVKQAYLKALVPTAHEEYGTATALSGDGGLLVIGVRHASVAGMANAGRFHLYRRDAGSYVLDQTLVAPQPAAGHVFGGYGVAMADDGSVIAIGEIGESGAGRGVGADATLGAMPGAGAVHVYRRVGAAYVHAYVKASQPGANDYFGYWLSLSAHGDVLAVGAPGEDGSATGLDGDPSDNSAPGRGAVYLY